MKQPTLNRVLALEAPEQVADGAGGFSVTWAVLGHVWAEVAATKGRESRIEARTVSQVPYKVTVRAAPVGALSRPQAHQRFREGDRVFRIIAVAERSPDARYLVCHTEEEIAG